VALSNGRTDVEGAKKRMSGAVGAAREIRDLPDCLLPDETVEEMATGLYQYRRGLLVLTDRRLLFKARGTSSGRIEEFRLDSISSVQLESSLLLASLVMYGDRASRQIDSMEKADARRMVTQVRARLGGRARPAGASSARGGAPEVVTLLKYLGELRDVGVLTTDEFQTKKAELLTRM
jgi:hypothetical protein